jgi:hypothetical protein
MDHKWQTTKCPACNVREQLSEYVVQVLHQHNRRVYKLEIAKDHDSRQTRQDLLEHMMPRRGKVKKGIIHSDNNPSD